MFGPTAFQATAFQTSPLAFQIGSSPPGAGVPPWSGFIYNMARLMVRRG